MSEREGRGAAWTEERQARNERGRDEGRRGLQAARERAGNTVLLAGEVMAVLRARQPLRLGGQVNLSVAGSEGNVAIGMARLGVPVRFAGRVGADELGALVLRTLRAEAVDVSACRTDPDAPTGLFLLEPGPGGRSRAIYHRRGSAGSKFTVTDADAAWTPDVDLLVVSGITPALSPEARQATEKLIGLAHEAGVPMAFLINHRTALWPGPEEAPRVLAPLAAQATVVLASEAELALIGGGVTEEAAAASLRAAGVAEVVVTRGAAGATCWAGEGTFEQNAVPVAAVDTVGAGDAFAAGYLTARRAGLPVPERLATGARVAAFAVAAHGDWEGLPSREDIALLDLEDGGTLR